MPFHLENIALGQLFNSITRLSIEDSRIKTFAAEFDRQPFHFDERPPPRPSKA